MLCCTRIKHRDQMTWSLLVEFMAALCQYYEIVLRNDFTCKINDHMCIWCIFIKQIVPSWCILQRLY